MPLAALEPGELREASATSSSTAGSPMESVGTSTGRPDTTATGSAAEGPEREDGEPQVREAVQAWPVLEGPFVEEAPPWQKHRSMDELLF